MTIGELCPSRLETTATSTPASSASVAQVCRRFVHADDREVGEGVLSDATVERLGDSLRVEWLATGGEHNTEVVVVVPLAEEESPGPVSPCARRGQRGHGRGVELDDSVRRLPSCPLHDASLTAWAGHPSAVEG